MRIQACAVDPPKSVAPAHLAKSRPARDAFLAKCVAVHIKSQEAAKVSAPQRFAEVNAYTYPLSATPTTHDVDASHPSSQCVAKYLKAFKKHFGMIDMKLQTSATHAYQFVILDPNGVAVEDTRRTVYISDRHSHSFWTVLLREVLYGSLGAVEMLLPMRFDKLMDVLLRFSSVRLATRWFVVVWHRRLVVVCPH